MKRIKGINLILLTLILISFSVETTLSANLFVVSGKKCDSLIKVAPEYSSFGLPSITPLEPTSNDTVTVSISISDSDGVRNATLYWRYVTLNDTLFSTSMTSSSQLIVDETKFQRTGYITDSGIETQDKTDWRFGEYIFVADAGEVITEIDLSIIRKVQNDLVYVKIEALNVSSEQWEQRYLDGLIGGTEEVSPYPVDYQSTEHVYGYRIYAITYIADRPVVNDPEFDFLYIYKESYSADIAPPNISTNTPTWVEYYVSAFDMLNNSMTSATFSFLMDWTPVITIQELPTLLGSDASFMFNVTVTDQDGVENIDDNSVVLYYKLEEEEEYVAQHFDFLIDPNSLQASYRTTLELSGVENIETNLEFMVNASDIVGLEKGREGTSGVKTAVFDSLNPRVTSITIEGGVSIPGLENVTLINSEVNITVEFTDPAGIKQVDILYSMPNGTEPMRLTMDNTTILSAENPTATFVVTLPSSNETAFVEYFFETYDFLGNVGNSSVNFYYSDGAAPILDTLLVYPPIISNVTDVRVLFNATDYSDLKTSVLWYSYDDGITWYNTLAYTINYDSYIDYSETFRFLDVPSLIEDNSTTLLPLYVERGGGVSKAILSVDITHEKSTDIRIWLVLDDGREYLIFDRETRSPSFTVELELIKFGLSQSDFTSGNFTLKIVDYSDLYSGYITNYEIELIHYTIPLGYEFQSVIPRSSNDTDVHFFITLTDSLYNIVNTSIYSYYSDGLAPNVTLIPIESPLDLEGAHTLDIYANVTDKGGLLNVEVYYKFNDTEEWTILSMKYDPTSSFYVASIPIFYATGNLTYKVRAYDLAGYSTESNVTLIEFENGLAPFIVVLDTPFPSPLIIEQGRVLRIRANVTDDSNVTLVQIYYREESDSEWKIEEMLFDSETQSYYFDIKLRKKEGTLIFKIQATDDLNLVSETMDYLVDYKLEQIINPLSYIIPIAAIGGVGVIALFILFLKKKGIMFAGN